MPVTCAIASAPVIGEPIRAESFISKSAILNWSGVTLRKPLLAMSAVVLRIAKGAPATAVAPPVAKNWVTGLSIPRLFNTSEVLPPTKPCVPVIANCWEMSRPASFNGLFKRLLPLLTGLKPPLVNSWVVKSATRPTGVLNSASGVNTPFSVKYVCVGAAVRGNGKLGVVAYSAKRL